MYSFSVSPWDGGGSYRIQMTSYKLHSSHLQIQIENLHPRWQGQWWGLLTKDTSPPAEGGDYPYPKEGQARGGGGALGKMKGIMAGIFHVLLYPRASLCFCSASADFCQCWEEQSLFVGSHWPRVTRDCYHPNQGSFKSERECY